MIKNTSHVGINIFQQISSAINTTRTELLIHSVPHVGHWNTILTGLCLVYFYFKRVVSNILKWPVPPARG